MADVLSWQGLPSPDEQDKKRRESPQLSVFLESYSAIQTGIMHSVCDVAHRAFSKHLISDTVRRDVTGTLSPLTPDQKTNRFLEELECRIRLDASALNKFIDILKELNAEYYKALTKTLSELFHSRYLLCSTGTLVNNNYNADPICAVTSHQH